MINFILLILDAEGHVTLGFGETDGFVSEVFAIQASKSEFRPQPKLQMLFIHEGFPETQSLSILSNINCLINFISSTPPLLTFSLSCVALFSS